jgi:hypothetical protein
VNKPLAEVPLDKFEPIAAQLGAPGVDWAIERLRRFAPLVGLHGKGYDDSFDREAFESALYLEHWLRIETKVYEKIGDDLPHCIDDVSIGLHELLPLIARYISQPRKGGRTPDNRRYVCAWVCSEIWKEVHGAYQPRSERLWEACEAYWLACGRAETSEVGRLKNWERYLLNELVSHP